MTGLKALQRTRGSLSYRSSHADQRQNYSQGFLQEIRYQCRSWCRALYAVYVTEADDVDWQEVPHALAPTPLTTRPRGQGGRRTGRVPKGNLFVALRIEFDALSDAQRFADVYPPAGRPMEVAPWRLVS
jgi:hypothetical protein